MSEKTLSISVFIAGFGLVLLFGLVNILRVHKKYLRLLSQKICPSCNKVLGENLKMEQGFRNVEKREQRSLPIKINITGVWGLMCPHCNTKSIYNFNSNEFSHW